MKVFVKLEFVLIGNQALYGLPNCFHIIDLFIDDILLLIKVILNILLLNFLTLQLLALILMIWVSFADEILNETMYPCTSCFLVEVQLIFYLILLKVKGIFFLYLLVN